MTVPFKAPAPAPAGAHILGQPFTLSNISIPVNATLTCNCAQPPSVLAIAAGAAVKCPVCQKTYAVVFNPQNGQIMVAMTAEESKVGS